MYRGEDLLLAKPPCDLTLDSVDLETATEKDLAISNLDEGQRPPLRLSMKSRSTARWIWRQNYRQLLLRATETLGWWLPASCPFSKKAKSDSGPVATTFGRRGGEIGANGQNNWKRYGHPSVQGFKKGKEEGLQKAAERERSPVSTQPRDRAHQRQPVEARPTSCEVEGLIESKLALSASQTLVPCSISGTHIIHP